RRVEPPGAGQTLQRVFARGVEGESRPSQQVMHGGRDQHLTGRGRLTDATTDVHRDAIGLVADAVDLTRVHAGADLEPGGSRLVPDPLCAPDSGSGKRKPSDDLVALREQRLAAVLLQ